MVHLELYLGLRLRPSLAEKRTTITHQMYCQTQSMTIEMNLVAEEAVTPVEEEEEEVCPLVEPQIQAVELVLL